MISSKEGVMELTLHHAATVLSTPHYWVHSLVVKHPKDLITCQSRS